LTWRAYKDPYIKTDVTPGIYMLIINVSGTELSALVEVTT